MAGGTVSAHLLDRAALLLRASDAVGMFCAEQVESFAYPEPTLKLFSYVGRIRELTREYVNTWLARSEKADDLAVIAESSFLTLAKFWSELHRYIKPAADAHALVAPSPLLRLARKRLGGVTGMSQSDFVVLITHELNYEHRPGKKMAAVKLIFRDDPFPPEIGFLAMPYSMGATLFANVLLYHELGHFAWLRLNDAGEPGISSLGQTVADAITRRLPSFKGMGDPDKTRNVSVVDTWLRELFCDLFAVRLIGPAFSLAFWDFKNILPGDEDEDSRFTSHPAPNARLLYQRQQLEEDGWWQLLEADVQYRDIPPIARMRGTPEAGSDKYGSDSVSTRDLVPVFFDCAGSVQALVKKVTNGIQSAALAFDANRNQVSSLLANGVVPSYKLDGSHGLLEEAVINSAYLFVQGLISMLERRIADQEDGAAAKRYRTIQRIDAWTLKAIEDLQFGSAE